jgi:cell division transport system permease protein
MKDYWYGKVQVSIYFCNKDEAKDDPNCTKGPVTAEQKAQIKSDLYKLKVVEHVYYESQEQAYKRFEQQFKGTPMAGSVTPDQMQESFRVKLRDPTKFAVVASEFQGRPGVQQVEDERKLLSNLFELLNGMTYVAWAVVGFMLAVALLLIVNTVRLSAFSRRRETGIMRLVGASGFYIQMPFIMEASFAGLVGSGLACVMLLIGRYFLIGHGLALQTKIPLIHFLGWGDVIAVLPLVLAAGVLIPAFAAFLALRKYLKV